MGDIKRKRKKFVRPRKIYDSARIQQENKIVEQYGLKNKREIWKADTAVSRMRRRAKLLISASQEEKEVFFRKLYNMGFQVTSIEDVLALNKEDLLKRRLQTLLVTKGLVKTPRQARQLIVHKHVSIDGKIMNSPSAVVPRELESKIELKVKPLKNIKQEEIKDE